jgi:glycosyltransferase involved in cell wall biosynthesis
MLLAVDISAIIITYNEEERLAGALRSLRGLVKEVIVVDGRSQDQTVKVAKQLGARVFVRDWTNYSDQKNFGNQKASSPWILSLDSDERVSPDLRAEVKALLPIEPDCDGFSIPRLVFYLGRWVRHSGWYPDRRVRLFRKDKACWEGEYVHEKLAFQGRLEKLRGPIHHFTYRSIAEHVARLNAFSGLGAKKLYAGRKKCHAHHLLFLPAARFLRTYFLKCGFLDGFAGLVIALLNGYAIFLRYAKLREIWKKGERIEPFPY